MRVFERKGKRGSTWYIDFTYKGRRMMEAVGPDRRLAEAVARKRETEIFEGHFFPEKKKSRFRFKDLAVEFMERHSKRNKRSWKRDVVSLNNLLPYFGDTYLDDISPRMIESYRIKRERDGVKSPTINREHGLLKSMFNRAIAWEMTGENPAKKVRMAKEKARNRFLTREEIQCLLRASETDWAPYLKPILVMALSTGMRKGEILKLTWDDVDFNRRAIQVKQTKIDEPREVPMTDWLFDTLQDWRNKNLDRTSEYVFINKVGQPLGNVRKAFATALKKAGIADFRFHDLRHTAASQMYMSGLDIKLIKEICGWKTLAILDRYAHLTTEHKRSAMMIYESFLLPDIETNSKQINIHSHKSL